MANKGRRLITVDLEIDQKLDGVNASSLINRLLKEYFDNEYGDDPKVLNHKLEDLKNDSEIQLRKIEHIENKLIIISQRQKQNLVTEERKAVLDKFSEISEELKLDWQQDKLTDDEYWESVDKLAIDKGKELSLLSE